MERVLALGLAAGLGLFAIGCGDGGRAAAEEGLGSAQAAFDAARDEAGPYAPEDLVKDIENSLAAARGTFASGNYRQALAEAQLLPRKISALGAGAEARKSELTSDWEELSNALPKIVSTIEMRIEELSKARRLPAGVTKEAFDGARTRSGAIARTWTEAAEAHKTDNLAEAVASARSVASDAVEVLKALGMQVPDELK